MNKTVEKVFYFSSLAVGSWVAKRLLDEYADLPLQLLCSTIKVHSYDEAYNYLLYWLMKQKFDADKNRLMAITSLTSGQGGWFSEVNKNNDAPEEDELEAQVQADAEYKASLANTRPLLWAPSAGTHRFRYRGRYSGAHAGDGRASADGVHADGEAADHLFRAGPGDSERVDAGCEGGVLAEGEGEDGHLPRDEVAV